jgi:hypothetical protein
MTFFVFRLDVEFTEPFFVYLMFHLDYIPDLPFQAIEWQ